MKNFAPKYDETARDVVAFANNKGGFLFIGIVDGTKEVNDNFVYDDEKVYELIHQVQDRTEPTITLTPHKIKVKGSLMYLQEQKARLNKVKPVLNKDMIRFFILFPLII